MNAFEYRLVGDCRDADLRQCRDAILGVMMPQQLLDLAGCIPHLALGPPDCVPPRLGTALFLTTG